MKKLYQMIAEGTCMDTYLPRIIEKEIRDYLDLFGAVSIVGPKWCGKTTTALRFSKDSLKMQDPRLVERNIALANEDPFELLKGRTPKLIDEWQVAPKIWDAVRMEVDDRGAPGQFILTGSSRPRLDATSHSGTGRIVEIAMRSMSLYESGESTGKVSLKELFDGVSNPKYDKSALKIQDLAHAICRGGWPNSITIGKKNREGSLKIAPALLTSILNISIPREGDVSRNPKWAENIIRSYARNISTVADKKTILGDVAGDGPASNSTLTGYLDAFETLYVIEDVPAWNPNIRSRTAQRSAPKRGFGDPSIAAAALDVSPEGLLADKKTMGFMFESLCIRDLRVYSQPLLGNVLHYRDQHNLECDAVIRLRDGSYALIKIKLGENQEDDAAKSLTKLRDLLVEKGHERPKFMMIMTGGRFAFRRDDGIYVVPAGCLKD